MSEGFELLWSSSTEMPARSLDGHRAGPPKVSLKHISARACQRCQPGGDRRAGYGVRCHAADGSRSDTSLAVTGLEAIPLPQHG